MLQASQAVKREVPRKRAAAPTIGEILQNARNLHKRQRHPPAAQQPPRPAPEAARPGGLQRGGEPHRSAPNLDAVQVRLVFVRRMPRHGPLQSLACALNSF